MQSGPRAFCHCVALPRSPGPRCRCFHRTSMTVRMPGCQDARPHQISPRGRAVHARTVTSGLFFLSGTSDLASGAGTIVREPVQSGVRKTMHGSLSIRWFRACFGAVCLLLITALLWNPMVDAADEIGAGGTAVTQACIDADQPDGDSIPESAVDAPRRAARAAARDGSTGARCPRVPGAVFPPPERPPRA